MSSTSPALPLAALARRAAATLTLLAGAAGAQLTPEWISTLPLGSSLSSNVGGVAIDDAGNSYVTGTTSPSASSSTDIVTAAFGPDGTLLWQRVFNGPKNWQDQGRAIAVGSDGSVYVTGNTPDPSFFANVEVLQYDAATGDLLKSIQYSSGPGTSEHGGAVAADASGNVYVGGGTVGDGGDALVLKFDANGKLLWKRIWDGPAFAPYSQDSAQQVLLDPNGDLVVLIYGVMASNHADYVVVKYAADTGAELWTANWGVNGEDSPNDMEIDAAGDVYVTGTGINLTNKFSTIKLRGSDGALLWQAYDSAGADDGARAVALDGQGGVYITGAVDPDGDQSNINDNIYTVKRDAQTGAQLWTHLYGSSIKKHLDLPSDVVVDPAGHVFVGGMTNSPPYTFDMITLVLDAGSGVETDRHIIPGGPGLSAASGFMRFDAAFNLFNGGEMVNADTGAVTMSLVKFTTLASPPYQMIVTQLTGGADATFDIAHATPLQLQIVAFSLVGTAALPVPSLGITLGLANPQLLLLAPADVTGAFGIALHIPAGATGVTAWFQAVQMNGATPVVKRTVQ